MARPGDQQDTPSQQARTPAEEPQTPSEDTVEHDFSMPADSDLVSPGSDPTKREDDHGDGDVGEGRSA